LADQFYSNRELYELIKQDINSIHVRLDKLEDEKIDPMQLKLISIDTMLRDYNGLWQKVDETKKNMDELEDDVNVKINEIKEEFNTFKSIETGRQSVKEKVNSNAFAIISLLIALGAVAVSLFK